MRPRLYTEAEWLAVKPMIEQLYIHELRPLARVMQILETEHNFKARCARGLSPADMQASKVRRLGNVTNSWSQW